MTLLNSFMPVLARPWFDTVSIRVVTRAYMPLSRAWAAAVDAEGDIDRFADGTGIPSSAWGLGRAVERVHRLHERYQAAMVDWNDAFWAPQPPPAAQRLAAERARRRAAAAFMSGRGLFLPWFRRLPPVAWAIPSPECVEQGHAPRLSALDTAYAPPPSGPVEASNVIEDDRFRTYWLRFPSPVLGGTVSAHVTEPKDAAGAPTLIIILADKRGIGSVELDTGICAQNMVLAAGQLGITMFITTVEAG